jgi:hypothetical protein
MNIYIYIYTYLYDDNGFFFLLLFFPGGTGGRDEEKMETKKKSIHPPRAAIIKGLSTLFVAVTWFLCFLFTLLYWLVFSDIVSCYPFPVLDTRFVVAIQFIFYFLF